MNIRKTNKPPRGRPPRGQIKANPLHCPAAARRWGIAGAAGL